MVHTNLSLSLLLLTLTAAGCGDPCMPNPIGNGATAGVISAECHDADATSIATGIETTGATDGESETGTPTADSSTGGSSAESSSGDGPGPDSTCATTPLPGKPWGPCTAEGTCDDPTMVFCYESPLGSICQPACEDEGPLCDVPLCMGGTCRVDGACVPSCESDADCPLLSMKCDPDAPSFPSCVHPG